MFFDILFPSTPQYYCIMLFNITRLVEGNSPKGKWIMGVCDLNYLLGRADIFLFLPHWNSQTNVSLFQPPYKLYTDERLVRLNRILSMISPESCHAWTGSVRSSRINDLAESRFHFIYFFIFLMVCFNSMEMHSFPLHRPDLWYYRSETRHLKKTTRGSMLVSNK